MKKFFLILTAVLAFVAARAQDNPVYLAVNWATESYVVNFEGNGGKEQLSVAASNGWWYIDGSIPWCEIKSRTDTSFALKCAINSSAFPRHAYIKVKTEGAADVKVAVVQASLPDNFLSTGAWRDSLGCGLFQSEARFLQLACAGEEIENCPLCMVYIGAVENGKKEGKGCCYDRYGNLIYSGLFKKDIPVGEYPCRDDYSSYKFECQKFSNGTYYLGETRDGIRHGYGIFVSSDRTYWFGRWSSGLQLVASGTTSTISRYDL